MHSSIARFMTFLSIVGVIALVVGGVWATGGSDSGPARQVGAVVGR